MFVIVAEEMEQAVQRQDPEFGRQAVPLLACLPPGHPDSLVDWAGLAQLRGTVVLLMAVDNAAHIAEALLSGGRPPSTPVAVLVEGTMPGAREVLSTLAELGSDVAAHGVRPPAIIVVGDVVRVARPERYEAEQHAHG